MDLEVIRGEYAAVAEPYKRLTARVHSMLDQETRSRGIVCELDARAKELASALKTVLLKGYGSLDQMPDLAAVRCKVHRYEQRDAIRSVIEDLFVVLNEEDKGLDLPATELGYLGIHFDVRLRTTGEDEADLGGRVCEIQLHTAAQNLWSVLAHPTVYKPAFDPPKAIKRRIFRLAAVVELFDSEAQSAWEEIRMTPGYQEAAMLDVVESEFYRLTTRAFDRELSLKVLDDLKSAYEESELEQFKTMMRQFVDQNEVRLTETMDRYQGDEDAGLLIFQPEGLSIFERLSRDRHRLVDSWPPFLPDKLLQDMGDIWGVAIP
jgi:ppGpp synthetase/RelA/SpoT-type nucleotidyltranferase